MASLKQIRRSALVEWCPLTFHPNLLALGGVGLDPALELCTFDLASNTLDMQIQSHTPVDSPFRCIAWGNFKKDQSVFQEGILAGGMDNGIVSLWDPTKLLHKQKDSDGLLQRLKINSERITCIEFNALRPHLFAVGGSDGTVSIVDAGEIPEMPTIYEPSSDLDRKGEISCLGWNRVVSHILATTSNGGSTVILDLKQKKAATSFRDPANRLRPSSLSWLPSNATQIVVSYDDDRSPSLQLWDLRNASFPIKDITGHTKGILSVAVNTLDSHLMLSCGKDNRTICWILSHSVDQPEIFGEIRTKYTHFDITWSPFQPGLYAAASMNEEISIHNIQMHQSTVSYIPKWMERTTGVHCGFGGKVVSFDSKIDKSVKCHIIATDEEFVMKADRFEQLLTEGNFDAFCYQKIMESQDEYERLTWSIVRSLFHPDRTAMIRELGFDIPSILEKVEAFLGHPPGSSFQETISFEHLSTDETMTTAALMPDVDPEKFFMELSEKNEVEKSKKSQEAHAQPTENKPGEMHPSELVDWNVGPENMIKQCLLTGNFIAAVEVCLRCGRLGDALILASMAGPDVLKKTQVEYMRRQKDPFLKVMACIVNGEMEQLVKISDLANWKETLSLLCTYAPADEFFYIAELLGYRLETERLDKRNAMICYLFAGNFSSTARIWYELMYQKGSFVVGLQDFIEKMAIMKAATQFNGQDTLLTKHVTYYAELLANSGRLLTAMRYLSLIEMDESSASALLRDRIYNSSPVNMQMAGVSPPRFPFEVMDVSPFLLPPEMLPSGIPSSKYASLPEAALARGGYYSAGPTDVAPYPPTPQEFGYGRNMPAYPTISTPPNPLRGGATGVPTPPSGEYYYAPPQPALNRASTVPAAPYASSPPASTMPPSATPPHLPPSPQYSSYAPQTIPSSHPSLIPPPTQVHPSPSPYVNRAVFSAPLLPQPSTFAPSPPGPPPGGATGYGPNVPPIASAWMPTAPTPPTAIPSTPPKTSLVSWPDAHPTQPPPASGEVLPPQTLQYVKRVLDKFLTQVTQQDKGGKRSDDLRKRIEDLYKKLENGVLSASTNSKIVSFCQAMDENDFVLAHKIHGDLIQHNWDPQSKTWLPALTRLLTK